MMGVGGVEAETGRGSIFSQRFDRSVFIGYFLGAVVPLSALAVVVEGYVLPVVSDPLAVTGLIAMVCSIAILSLLSYLVLRRSTKHTLSRIDRDKRRLATLLESSQTMTGAGHAGEIAACSVACAIDLSDARAAYLLIRGKRDDLSPELFESAGKDAESYFRSASTHLLAQAECVMESGQPAFLSAIHTAIEDRPPAILLPLLGEDGAIGILAVVRGGSDQPFEPAQLDALNALASMTAVAMRNADLRDLQRNFFRTRPRFSSTRSTHTSGTTAVTATASRNSPTGSVARWVGIRNSSRTCTSRHACTISACSSSTAHCRSRPPRAKNTRRSARACWLGFGYGKNWRRSSKATTSGSTEAAIPRGGRATRSRWRHGSSQSVTRSTR